MVASPGHDRHTRFSSRPRSRPRNRNRSPLHLTPAPPTGKHGTHGTDGTHGSSPTSPSPRPLPPGLVPPSPIDKYTTHLHSCQVPCYTFLPAPRPAPARPPPGHYLLYRRGRKDFMGKEIRSDKKTPGVFFARRGRQRRIARAPSEAAGIDAKFRGVGTRRPQWGIAHATLPLVPMDASFRKSTRPRRLHVGGVTGALSALALSEDLD